MYDPAAGTAGFLVAAYERIRLANSSPHGRERTEFEGKTIEREYWNLSASRYRPESREAVEHRDPRELLAELRDETAAILADIDALAAEFEERAA